MRAEILAVGTELLLGDILNTNAQFLSKELALMGIDVYFQTVVGDNRERLLQALELAFGRAELVIASGGLGPTADDITKETCAEFFGRGLYLDKDCEIKLKERFKGNNMPLSNMKQAYMPEGAEILTNPWGTADGCIITENKKTLIILPGPPNELVPLFNSRVKKYLAKMQNKIFISKELHLCGIGESAGAEAVRDLLENENPTVAPYAKINEMMFRITACGGSEEECNNLIEPVKAEIYNRLGEYIYGEDKTTLSDAVVGILKEKNLTIATAESCTGGLVAARIVDCAGASAVLMNGVVSYSNESKIKNLGVKEETLQKFGAVSEQTCEEMCRGVARVSNTHIGISTTGVAGPGGGTDEKPVGLVYIGVCIKDKVVIKKLMLKGDRNKIRNRATTEVLNLLRQSLKEI